MSCVYTGAYVHFTDYDAYAPADLFMVRDNIVVLWMTNGWSFEPLREVTHKVTIGPDGYHHEGRGITVVHNELCEGERR